MKRIITILILNITSQFVVAQSKIFTGAWFEIKYPANFIARGSLISSTSDGFESAIFKSPDNLVEFYVFSPQWRGEAKDIEINYKEKLTASKSQVNAELETKWWTISAKDGSYSRSYQEKINKLQNTNWVIGVKYKNSSSLDKYKKEYSAFKNSLKQFAD